MAAERGGADRIELCENLAVGGVTPSLALQRAVRESVGIPVHVMVRPRGGDFLYTQAEYEQMIVDLANASESGADGIVLGILRDDGRVDVQRTLRLIDRARPLPVTFHRAFDATPDLRQALEDVIAAGAARVLTAGGPGTAETGVEALAELRQAASGRIEILAGGGIRSGNIAGVVQRSGVREVHSGLTAVLAENPAGFDAFTREVSAMVNGLRAAEPGR